MLAERMQGVKHEAGEEEEGEGGQGGEEGVVVEGEGVEGTVEVGGGEPTTTAPAPAEGVPTTTEAVSPATTVAGATTAAHVDPPCGQHDGVPHPTAQEPLDTTTTTTTATPQLAKRASKQRKPRETHDARRYRYHKWNINNLPRSAGSVLRHVVGDELVTGVMVPWLYIGSALSAFCWHVEDHGFYSINYMHMGQPKVWYV